MYLKPIARYFSLKNTNMRYIQHLVIGLLFLFPIFGFLYFAVKYDILEDSQIPFFFLGVLVFFVAGHFYFASSI